jgi:uncharacterized protein with GYD domain
VRTFILLSTLTHQGMETLAVTPERLFEVNREIEALGGRVVDQWAVLGPYDFLSVIEAPDEAAVAEITMELSSRGSAHFETLTAVEIEDLVEPPETSG